MDASIVFALLALVLLCLILAPATADVLAHQRRRP